MSVFLQWRRTVRRFALQRKAIYEPNSKEKFIRLFVLWCFGRWSLGRDDLQIRSLKFQNKTGTSYARRKKKRQCVLPFNPISLGSEREKIIGLRTRKYLLSYLSASVLELVSQKTRWGSCVFMACGWNEACLLVSSLWVVAKGLLDNLYIYPLIGNVHLLFVVQAPPVYNKSW